MSVETVSGDQLVRAFDGFRTAAAKLELRHGELQREVGHLRGQLLDAHRRLEAVVDALDAGVAVLTSDATVLRANRAFVGMGLDPSADADLTGLTLGGPDRAGTVRLRRTAAGIERDLAVTVLPVGDRDGTRVLTVQDVTEIRREEEEGGRRLRLEALGRMAAELAHELRNPLGGIRLFASMLRDDLHDRQPQREMAEQILDAGSSLEATLSNLLNFAAPSQTAARQVDLAALATDVCALLAPACALRGVRLDGPDRLGCRSRVDPEALRQVLLNLVGNALAATGQGGRIRVRTETQAQCVVLTVEDSGVGISPEDLPHVFDPFFSRSEGGTGLGLSIVHRIVERHDGKVSLESSPGKGTRACIKLPVTSPEETE